MSDTSVAVARPLTSPPRRNWDEGRRRAAVVLQPARPSTNEAEADLAAAGARGHGGERRAQLSR